MQRGIEEKRQGKNANIELKRLEKGFDFGKRLYKTRDVTNYHSYFTNLIKYLFHCDNRFRILR